MRSIRNQDFHPTEGTARKARMRLRPDHWPTLLMHNVTLHLAFGVLSSRGVPRHKKVRRTQTQTQQG